MIRRLFYRGRHHVRTAQRDDAGALVTVSTIAARIRREARLRAIGSAFVDIRADIEALSPMLRAMFDQHRRPA